MTGEELLKLMDEAGIEYMTGCRCIYKLQISDLAKFIDNYFLPRPLFEDGTPVKVGDEFALHKPSDSEKIIVYRVFDDGSFSVNNRCYDQDQRVKKPEQPEYLDADGVPIKIDDKLYFVGGEDTPLKCLGFYPDGDVIFTDWEETGTIAYENATAFTHKKPDSWEQLKADAGKSGMSYWECEDIPLCKECEHSSYKTGKDCWQNMNLDIVRRAKALAGVKDE